MDEHEENKKLQEKILQFKKKEQVVLFAHNYQRGEIQEIADVLGDSLDLAMKVKKYPPQSKILYAAVSFMAEIAVLLNPTSKIYFPIPDAKCPMANFGTVELLKKYKAENPYIPIVLYINSTTEAKQYADVICTSSSAVEICKKIQAEWKAPKIAFGPDKNLAHWVQSKLQVPIDILPPNGHCIVHDKFTKADVQAFRKKFPTGKVIVHPECPADAVNAADFVGSTSAMYTFVKEHPTEIIGIGTELGLVDRVQREFKNTHVYPLTTTSVCYTMKKFTLESILYTLENLNDDSLIVKIPESIAKAAIKPINKMFEILEAK